MQKIKNFIYKIAAALGYQRFHLFYYEKDLTQEIPEINSLLPIEIRPASQADIELLIKLSDKEFGRLLSRYSADKKNQCLIVWLNGQPVGYGWHNTETISIQGEKIAKLSPGKVWVFGGYVFPEYRNNNIFTALNSFFYTGMKSRGYKKICNFVDINNPAAIISREKLCVDKKTVHIILLPFGLKLILGGPIG